MEIPKTLKAGRKRKKVRNCNRVKRGRKRGRER
jgi:hypothetical protein